MVLYRQAQKLPHPPQPHPPHRPSRRNYPTSWHHYRQKNAKSNTRIAQKSDRSCHAIPHVYSVHIWSRVHSSVHLNRTHWTRTTTNLSRFGWLARHVRIGRFISCIVLFASSCVSCLRVYSIGILQYSNKGEKFRTLFS